MQVERRARQGPQRMLKIWRKDVRNGYRLMEQWQVRPGLFRQVAALGTRALPMWPASAPLICNASLTLFAAHFWSLQQCTPLSATMLHVTLPKYRHQVVLTMRPRTRAVRGAQPAEAYAAGHASQGHVRAHAAARQGPRHWAAADRRKDAAGDCRAVLCWHRHHGCAHVRQGSTKPLLGRQLCPVLGWWPGADCGRRRSSQSVLTRMVRQYYVISIGFCCSHRRV